MMKCDICGNNGITTKKVTRSFGMGKDLLIIEDIPVQSCPHCSERYVTAETLLELERIKMHRHSFAVKRPVELAVFA